ncbi:hypothetical protein IAT40_002242 [Kwoniella sp. CBS 6097]
MPSLAVLILAVVTFTQVVSWVGQTVLQELVFSLYSKIFLSSTASKQSKLRKQVLEDKAELGRTSSQDEFAKWAKIKRRVDKGLADLEQLNTTLGSSRSSFAVKFKSLIWTLTTGAQLFLVWWYRKEPVFWLPTGWVPYPVAWVLSFPSAPIGSVSSGAWSSIISRVLLSLEEIVKSLLAPSPTPVPGTAPFPTRPQKQEAKIEPITIEHEKLD